MVGTAFVGRGDEMVRLGRVLRGDPDAAPVAVVTGDAGIGKTRLLAEVLRASPHVLVLAGACLPLSESLPYGAITDAFAEMADPIRRPVLDRALARCAPFVRTELGALIPALSDGHSQSPEAAPDRTRLFTAVRDLLEAAGAERRTALAVEDLHWADPGTLDLMMFLVRRLPPGTAVVATSRLDELGADNPAVDWLATIARVPRVEQITMTPLPREDVAALVASLVERDPADAFVRDILRRGEGNPFFTEQLVASARDVAPPLEVPAGVPHGVAQVLLGRVRSVGAAAREVAAVLAVAARPLAEPELAVCVGAVDVAAGLRELLDARLVLPTDVDRYRLRHALLEDTVQGTLLASQRALLHAGVAGVLASRGGESPAEVAMHWAAAGHVVEEARWSVDAARQAESLYSWREATALWRRVWQLWSELPDGRRPDVALPDVVVSCVRDASRVNVNNDGDDTFVHLAEEALADVRVAVDDEATAQLLSWYGQRLAVFDVSAGLAASERAVRLFERAGRPSAEYAYAVRSFTRNKVASVRTSGTEDAELAFAAAIAEAAGAVDAGLVVAADRGQALFEAGHVGEALAVLERAQEASEGRAASGGLFVAVAAADTYLWMLRLRDGIRAGRRGLASGLRGGLRESFGFAILVANIADCLLLLGETEAGRELVDEYLVPDLTISWWPLHLCRAELDVLAGDLDAAVRSVGRLEELQYSHDEVWMRLSEIGAAADLWRRRPQSARERIDRACGRPHTAVRAGRMLAFDARAAADLADSEPAVDRERLARDLRDRADQAQCFTAHPGRVMSAAYGATFDAELARLLRTSGQAGAWHAAKEVWAEHDVTHHAAYAGWRLAEYLLETGQRKAAEDELASAYDAAQGHVPLRAVIERVARRARLPLHTETGDRARPADEAAASAAYGLTTRELEVLRLLGTGATNGEIGRRLYMSPKTASVHVTAILRKLGVTGRVQAATMAERMGLLDHE